MIITDDVDHSTTLQQLSQSNTSRSPMVALTHSAGTGASPRNIVPGHSGSVVRQNYGNIQQLDYDYSTLLKFAQISKL